MASINPPACGFRGEIARVGTAGIAAARTGYEAFICTLPAPVRARLSLSSRRDSYGRLALSAEGARRFSGTRMRRAICREGREKEREEEREKKRGRTERGWWIIYERGEVGCGGIRSVRSPFERRGLHIRIVRVTRDLPAFSRAVSGAVVRYLSRRQRRQIERTSE